MKYFIKFGLFKIKCNILSISSDIATKTWHFYDNLLIHFTKKKKIYCMEVTTKPYVYMFVKITFVV